MVDGYWKRHHCRYDASFHCALGTGLQTDVVQHRAYSGSVFCREFLYRPRA